MRTKIAILGSTGSIGYNLLKIIKKDKKNFEIILLTANKNHKKIFKQAKEFKVKNLIINDKKSYEWLKKKTKNLNINIYNNYFDFKKIFKKKIDYVMSSIIGLDGLYPTLNIIKHTKKIAIANKETLICAWDLIRKELIKNRTKFIPVDSEHYSIFNLLENHQISDVEKIIITASGGPFLNYSKEEFKSITPNKALNHPNWKMGKKITIDSATLMNKLFEVIEAKNIFNIPYNKIKILIHPKSYVHAIIKTNDGLIKIIAHDTTMKIPIYNTLIFNNKKKIITKKINISKLNNLSFENVNSKRYPIINLLKLIPNNHSLYETIIVSANDVLVDLFLKKQINFNEIGTNFFKVINQKEFIKYKKIRPKNVKEIVHLNNYVRLKILEKVYKSDYD